MSHRVTPFPHQISVAKELAEFPSRLIADDRGCGKTGSGILLDQGLTT